MSVTITLADRVRIKVGTGPQGPAGPTSVATVERTVKSTSFTAANDGIYAATATLTVTDPTPSEGKGFSVLVRNGTVTIGGTAYSTAGTIVDRTYHSGAWASYQYKDSSAYGTAAQAHDAVTVSGNGLSLSGQQISLSIGTGSTQVAAGNHTHTASQISDSTAAGLAMLTAADAAAQVALLNAVTTAVLAARSIHVRQGSNQIVNNSNTPVASALVLPLDVGTWEITGFAVTTSASTNIPGVRFKFTFSGALNADGYDRVVATQATSGTGNASIQQVTIGSNIDSISASTQHHTTFVFVVRVTTAGNLVLSFSQKVATAENTTLSLLSNLTAKKIRA